MNKVPYTLSEDSICVFWEGKPYTIRNDNANYNELRRALFEARYDDVGQYLDLKQAIKDFVNGEVEIKDEVVYYKGFRLAGVVVDKLLEMLRGGLKDSEPLVNYIKRLMENPSSNSIEELYTFLGYRSLPITPDGKILGYKGVQEDFYSTTGNADTIVLQGTTNANHQIFNGVGETIEVQRRCVDDNRDNHCSHGLHIGSFDYAEGWSGCDGKLLLVEFDPQDAVSVPTDCSFQKLRVSKYKVVADITDCKKELNKAVYEYNKPIYNSPDEDVDEDVDGDWDDYDEEVDFDADVECDENENTEALAQMEEIMSKEVGLDDEHYEEMHLTKLAIRNYIENKHDEGNFPSVKQIRSLKVVRDAGLNTAEVRVFLSELGFVLEDGEDISLTDKLVLPSAEKIFAKRIN